MRRLAGYVVGAAVVAVAVYLAVEVAFFDQGGEAKADFSWQSVVVLAVLVAVLLALLLGLGAELRLLARRRSHHGPAARPPAGSAG